jgi:serine/threonine protein kinase
VYTGQLKTASGNEIEVAIKTLREAGQMHQKGWVHCFFDLIRFLALILPPNCRFLAEARIMRQLRHENVIRIYGVAVYETPFMICMELCEGGSLLKQLRTKTAGPEQKLKWAQEAAKGLEYIARKDLVHRWVAFLGFFLL